MTTITNITDKAMLVDLTIRQWTATKYDPKVSEEVAQAHGADSSVGWYSKTLVSREALEKVRKLANEAGAEHRRRTLPWLDKGGRILSSAGYFDYAQAMRSIETEWQGAVDVFVANYETYREEAKVRLGTMFNENDYPAADRIRNKFSLGYNVFPLPSGNDFRVSLGETEVARLRVEIEANLQEAVKEAMYSVVERIRETVDHMRERLRAYTVNADGRVEGTFRDTLVWTVRDLIDLLPSLNLTNDPRIDGIAQAMAEGLSRYEPQMLRDNQRAREETAEAAEAILDKMKDFVL